MKLRATFCWCLVPRTAGLWGIKKLQWLSYNYFSVVYTCGFTRWARLGSKVLSGSMSTWPSRIDDRIKQIIRKYYIHAYNIKSTAHAKGCQLTKGNKGSYLHRKKKSIDIEVHGYCGPVLIDMQHVHIIISHSSTRKIMYCIYKVGPYQARGGEIRSHS